MLNHKPLMSILNYIVHDKNNEFKHANFLIIKIRKSLESILLSET